MSDCLTCGQVPECVDDADLFNLSQYSLEGAPYPFVLNCPPGSDCAQTLQTTLLCCGQEIVVVYLPSDSAGQRSAKLLAGIMRCQGRCSSQPGGNDYGYPPSYAPGKSPANATTFLYSTAQIGQSQCPGGSVFYYTAPAGFKAFPIDTRMPPSVRAGIQASINRDALKAANSRAAQIKICFTPIPTHLCLGNGAESVPIVVTGSLVNYSAAGNLWSLTSGSLPPGMTLNTGVVRGDRIHLSGTPTTPGIYTFTVNMLVGPSAGAVIINGTGSVSASQSYTVRIAGITSAGHMPAFEAGVLYSYQLTADFMGTNLRWGLSIDPDFDLNYLPDGVTLDTLTGMVSGTPVKSHPEISSLVFYVEGDV
jgi:hypothetical protein